jgi:apolipoprotein N-acyltransferase
MAKRSRVSGGFSVSGPGYDRGDLPTVHYAISSALGAATRASEDGTWYVRGNSTQATHAIQRIGRTIHVTKTGAAT